MKKKEPNRKIDKGKELLKELSSMTKFLSDEEVAEVLGTGLLDDLLTSILDPDDRKKSNTLQDFLLANKYRSTVMALLRLAITTNYSFKGTSDKGESGFVSPYHLQWFDDGVMFVQGKKPFDGLLGCYRSDGKVSYAIAARDASEGDLLGPEHFEFIEEEEWRERRSALRNTLKISNLEEPIIELSKLLNSSCNDTSGCCQNTVGYWEQSIELSNAIANWMTKTSQTLLHKRLSTEPEMSLRLNRLFSLFSKRLVSSTPILTTLGIKLKDISTS